MRVAGGEHVPNQVVFKNFLASGALDIAQPDVVRLGGLPEYLAVALMAAKRSVPVLPHAGDMGQVHQHLTFFTRIALGLPELPLEMIPHLAEHFAEPCKIVAGRYRAPSAPGASTTIRDESIRRFAVRGRTSQGFGRGASEGETADRAVPACPATSRRTFAGRANSDELTCSAQLANRAGRSAHYELHRR